MNFYLQPGIWRSVFAVPCEVADKHLQMCTGLSVKILLLILRSPDQPIEVGQLCERLCMPAEDVRDALNYWIGIGLIQTDGYGASQPVLSYETVSMSAPPVPLELQPVPPEPALALASPEPPPEELIKPEQSVKIDERTGQKVVTMTSRTRLSRTDIHELSKKDDGISYLLQEAQLVLGDTFNSPYSEMLVSLHTYYGMSPDIILMLLQYCASIQKSNMRYVEKTACTWVDYGIDTHEKAEVYIQQLTMQDDNQKRIMTAFGIHNRNLTTKEKECVTRWFCAYHYDLNMIQLAYERTVETTGKVSFAYTDTILTSWFRSQITTPKQVYEEQAAFQDKSKSDRPAEYPKTSYQKASAPGKELLNKALDELSRRRQSAQGTLQSRKDELYEKLPELLSIERELSRTGLNAARAAMSGGGDVTALIKQLQEDNVRLQNRREQLLKDAGCASDYLEIPYHCKKCEDTGYIQGVMCTCLKELIGR